jgi:eukaryotic-like serine/threonine-protein kinase
MHIERGALLAGRYLVEERLGTGGMGSVWRALDLRLERPVALKLADPTPISGGTAGQARRRLRREADALAALTEPRIASIYDMLETDQDVCLVMELVDGESLAARLEREPRIPVAEALQIAAECAQALNAAHRIGIVHRDVKPSNIMLAADGARMVDFGIAAYTGPAHADTTQTMTRNLVGTAAYFAPERATGAPAGPAADFYSLGVVLYQMVAGSLPHRSEDTLAMLYAHVTAKPEPLPADVPAPVAALCLRLLAKNPRSRPTDAAQIVAAQNALTDAPATSKRTLPLPRIARQRLVAAARPHGWKGAPIAALCGVAALLVAATSWIFVNESGHAGAATPATSVSRPSTQGSGSAVVPPLTELVNAMPTPSKASPTKSPPPAAHKKHHGGGDGGGGGGGGGDRG